MRIIKTLVYILYIVITIFIIIASGNEDNNCKHVYYDHLPAKIHPESDKIAIYICFHGYNETSIWAIWSDVLITVKTKEEKQVTFIEGQSCEEVIEQSKDQSWMLSFVSWLQTNTATTETSKNTLLYNQHCFSISSDSEIISIEVKVEKLRIFYLVLMIIGTLVFLKADDISRNVLFYYSSGISMGMILSILLLIFIISKMMPKRSIGYAFLFCGTSVAVYLLQSTKQLIISETSGRPNWLLISYFIASGVVSFLYCYYRGPVTSERGFDIMRWCLQFSALFLVYYSVRSDKIAFAFVLILIITRWISCGKYLAFSITWTWMPIRLQAYFNKPKLISMEEYDKQGHAETTRALKLLQEYCNSPDCDTWKTVSRLKSPKSFASFISGGEHVTENERREYDEVTFDDHIFMTSDEDSDTELAKIALDFTEINDTKN